jgi:hypothetical protein
MTGSKNSHSERRDATAVDAVKTRQEAEAELNRKAAAAKAEKAARPSGAPETDDSPKRQGDKLEQARDAAAGRPTRRG